MVVVWPPSSEVAAVMPTIDLAFRNHEILTEKMHEVTAVPPGSYALFYHDAHLYERMKDVKMIVTRIAENREFLTGLIQREDSLRPEKQVYKQTLSKRLQAVGQKRSEVQQHMKLDMESLFIFGNLLLDQWSHVIGYLAGDREPERLTFVNMTYQLQKKGNKGLLEPLWNNHYTDILWLFYQIRNYRNIFIEHVTSPWDRGTAMETYGDSFRLGSPSPVNWISQEEIEQEVDKIRHLAPQWAQDPRITWYTQSPRQMLEIIFFYIDEITEQHQREEVWNVWKRIGGWTFSYDMIVFRLMRFTAESAFTMLDIITKHPDAINVGAVQTSQP